MFENDQVANRNKLPEKIPNLEANRAYYLTRGLIILGNKAFGRTILVAVVIQDHIGQLANGFIQGALLGINQPIEANIACLLRITSGW